MNNSATQVASKQALWFLIVGASAALVHFLVLVSIVNLTSIGPIWANVGAFLVAFIVSFSGHFYFTFRQNLSVKPFNNEPVSSTHSHYNKSTIYALIKWFASSVLGFLINQSLFVLGLNWLGERYYIIIWLMVTAIITVMTFALGKLWAFKT